MNLVFFAYRDWAIDIFKNISSSDNPINKGNRFRYILFTNKNACDKEFLDGFHPEIVFFYGWSWMIPEDIVNAYTCICLHPSPLPKYRGGSPIQNQIQNGEVDSKVSLFKMDAGMDTGPLYPMSYTFSLENTLSVIFDSIRIGGSALTRFLLEDHINGQLRFNEQKHDEATSFKRLKPSDSEIKPEDFAKHDAKFLYNKIRSLEKPYPEAFVKCNGGKIILEKVRYESD